MSRPAVPSVTMSVQKDPPIKHPSGHVITVHADNGIWDENTNSPLTPEQVVRK